MKITDVTSLVFPEVKVIRFERFADQRGYFTETYRLSDFKKIIPDFTIYQINESRSTAGVIRGLHCQWQPAMGKLVRTITGHMVDLFLDLRKNSPNFGKIAGFSMPSRFNDRFDQWIWVPPGFAHGNFYLEDSAIEYLCTAEYNPAGEVSICPLAPDIDWSVCDKQVAELFHQLQSNNPILSEKDKQGFTIKQWQQDQRSNNIMTP